MYLSVCVRERKKERKRERERVGDETDHCEVHFKRVQFKKEKIGSSDKRKSTNGTNKMMEQ